MKENKEKQSKTAVKTEKKKRNILIIICAVFLALLLIFGIAMAVITVVREANSVLSYGGIYVDRGVASYLAATYKNEYINILDDMSVEGVSDSSAFWASKAENGRTYGETLTEYVEESIRQVTVGSYIFDSITSFTSSEREYIDSGVNAALTALAGGRVDTFNRLSASMGFDFDDFKRGCEMMYKASVAKIALYGSAGSYLDSPTEHGFSYYELDEYFSTYSHVQLLYIRTQKDDKPNSNTEEIVELDDTAKAKRLADIEKIEELIEAYEAESGSERMSPEEFRSYQYKYNPTNNYISAGMYFSDASMFTAGFAEELGAELKDTILDMDEGSYARVDVMTEDYGNTAIFVYKYESTPRAYLLSDLGEFFEDFSSDAADYLYAKRLASGAKDVNVKDEYYDIDVVALPANGEFIVR